MSEYLKTGRHEEMTSAVQAHFGIHGSAKGANAKSVLPAGPKGEPFTQGSGVNHIEPANAGHRTA